METLKQHNQLESKAPEVKAPFQRRKQTLSVGVRPSRLCVLLIGIVGLVVWKGSDRQPADWTQSLLVRQPQHVSLSLGPVFRVATFNMHGGRNKERKYTLEQMPKLLDGYELVGLNEVRCAGCRWWHQANQADVLGERLKLCSVFAPTECRWWHNCFGNALLSKTPPRSLHLVPLPCTQGRKYRNALLASLDVNGTTVRVLVTHLDNRIDHDAQLKAVVDLFLSLQPPALLMGDLNTSRADPILQTFLQTTEVVDVVGKVLGDHDPADRIDWILARKLEVRQAGIAFNLLSDHPLVWAELQLPLNQERRQPNDSYPSTEKLLTDNFFDNNFNNGESNSGIFGHKKAAARSGFYLHAGPFAVKEP